MTSWTCNHTGPCTLMCVTGHLVDWAIKQDNREWSKDWRQFLPTQPDPHHVCQTGSHCYCQAEDVRGIAHKKCCKCNDRLVGKPQTGN